MSIEAWVSMAALLLSIGVSVFNAGRQSERINALKDRLDEQNREIAKLRAWHHKVGEDPGLPCVLLFRELEKRVIRIEEDQA